MLHVKNISFHRNFEPLFSDLSLTSEVGSLTELHGTNGSGKTTVLRLLSGLIEPETGSITWHGINVQEREANLCEQMSYIGHKLGLKAELTVLENLEASLGISGGITGIDPIDAIKKVGLQSYSKTQCSRLSAGQVRRASLARLLIKKCQLWLLDEPFSNLDENGHKLLMDMLQDQLKNGMAVVTSNTKIDWQNINAKRVLMDS